MFYLTEIAVSSLRDSAACRSSSDSSLNAHDRKHGDKDVYAARFSQNLERSLDYIFQVPENEQVRALHIVFVRALTEVVCVLYDVANRCTMIINRHLHWNFHVTITVGKISKLCAKSSGYGTRTRLTINPLAPYLLYLVHSYIVCFFFLHYYGSLICAAASEPLMRS